MLSDLSRYDFEGVIRVYGTRDGTTLAVDFKPDYPLPKDSEYMAWLTALNQFSRTDESCDWACERELESIWIGDDWMCRDYITWFWG